MIVKGSIELLLYPWCIEEDGNEFIVYDFSGEVILRRSNYADALKAGLKLKESN